MKIKRTRYGKTRTTHAEIASKEHGNVGGGAGMRSNKDVIVTASTATGEGSESYEVELTADELEAMVRTVVGFAADRYPSAIALRDRIHRITRPHA